MNRRDFLKTLAALGGAYAVPFQALAAAPVGGLARAWAEAQEHPAVFYVREYGTLTTDPAYDVYPARRGEIYGFDAPETVAELKRLADDHYRIAAIVEDAQYEADAASSIPWQQWLVVQDADTQRAILAQVEAWIDSDPDESDFELATLRGDNGQGYALNYFRDDFPFCEELGIAIVEGECPGSSYYAAELTIGIEEANQRAGALGIPVRFAWLGF